MNHEELLAEIDSIIGIGYAASGFSEYAANGTRAEKALRAVVELHHPSKDKCWECSFPLDSIYVPYPCPTIQAIEKELG